MRLSEWHYQPRHVNPRIQVACCKMRNFISVIFVKRRSAIGQGGDFVQIVHFDSLETHIGSVFCLHRPLYIPPAEG